MNRLPAYGDNALKISVTETPQTDTTPAALVVECHNDAMQLAQKRKLVTYLDAKRFPNLAPGGIDVQDPWLIQFTLKPNPTETEVMLTRESIKAAIYYFCLVPEPQHS